MHLTHRISPDRRTLTICADAETRAELREMTAELGDEFDSDFTMHDAFDRLIGNSELQWIDPATCCDLTDAPILGIWGEDRWVASHRDGDGTILCGGDSRRAPLGVNVCDVTERWAWMPYQVQSVLEVLRDTGEAVFTAP